MHLSIPMVTLVMLLTSKYNRDQTWEKLNDYDSSCKHVLTHDDDDLHSKMEVISIRNATERKLGQTR